MFRNVCLVLTLAFTAASASATRATQAHRHTPALAPTHKAHAAAASSRQAKTHPAKAAPVRTKAKAAASRKTASTKTSRVSERVSSRAASRASLRSDKRSARGPKSRAELRAANRRDSRRGQSRAQARRMYEEAVRRCRHCQPEPRIETASLHTTRSLPVPEVKPEPKLEVKPTPAPAAAPAPKFEFTGAMPAPLKGSLESLQRQNTRTEQEGLERILDEDDLNNRIATKVLVPVPVSSALGVNTDLAESHRYVRPWTANFLSDLSKDYSTSFHEPIQVTSAVRTVEYQKRLMHVNGNATAAEGDVVSPHLTGATIDIGKNGMSRSEIAWMRTRLLQLQQEGKLDVEEEFRQPCFHITVYKEYAQASLAQAAKPAAKTAK